jgi:hypothetical protein
VVPVALVVQRSLLSPAWARPLTRDSPATSPRRPCLHRHRSVVVTCHPRVRRPRPAPGGSETHAHGTVCGAAPRRGGRRPRRASAAGTDQTDLRRRTRPHHLLRLRRAVSPSRPARARSSGCRVPTNFIIGLFVSKKKLHQSAFVLFDRWRQGLTA